MCFDNVFTIIVRDVTKLLEKFKRYNLFPRYTLTKSQKNFKTCYFCKIEVTPPPSIDLIPR